MMEIMDKQLASKHHCLKKCEKVNMNCVTKRVYGYFGETDPQHSKVSTSASTTSSASTAATGSRAISACTATGVSTANSASGVISGCTATGASTATSVPRYISACTATAASSSSSSSMAIRASTPSSASTSKIFSIDSVSTFTDNVPSTSAGESEYTWSHEAIKLLIFSYNENKEKFDSPSYTKKRVWDIISESLAKKGIAKNPQKCDEKWRNLKKTYEKIRAEKNKTGNHSVQWRYFDDFQELYLEIPISSQ
ncbi:putative protein TPRXL [Coccinella septempunctata]|uniref:putative protein TPRXL n=1 Tax=Coccinella septempunctata TaxID=41139 RepID=UPI001D077FFE|nr:putative protein TPRXL [Coccinella septempunctata]